MSRKQNYDGHIPPAPQSLREQTDAAMAQMQAGQAFETADVNLNCELFTRLINGELSFPVQARWRVDGYNEAEGNRRSYGRHIYTPLPVTDDLKAGIC